MKLIKWLIAIIVVVIAYVVLSDMAAPYLRITADGNQRIYGDTITFDITVINFSPQPKEITIAPGDSTDIAILVDKANPAQRISKADADTTVTIPPFANYTVKRPIKLMAASGDRKTPQVAAPTNTVLNVIAGQHTVRATWGGHTSDEFTFGVR